MEVLARLATTDDVPTLADLYRGYREAVEHERGGGVHLAKEMFSEPLEVRLGQVVHDETRRVLLGLVDGVPVGLAVARLEFLADSSRWASLEVLYVDPPAREVGVGEKLLEVVASWAAERGAGGLDVAVLPGVRDAKNFLEGAGYVTRLLVMHRRLDGGNVGQAP